MNSKFNKKGKNFDDRNGNQSKGKKSQKKDIYIDESKSSGRSSKEKLGGKRTEKYAKSNNRVDRFELEEDEDRRKGTSSPSNTKNKGKQEFAKDKTSNFKRKFDRKSPRVKNTEQKPSVHKDSLRLNKFIANAGICSRREADEYIKTGLVKVNGIIVTEMGIQVKPTDQIKVNDALIRPERPIYVLMNKPKGYTCTLKDEHAEKTVIELLNGSIKERVFPVGRLDRNSTGVLLLTNDGELTKKLTHPKYEKTKVYQVGLDKKLENTDLQKLIAGVELEDGEAKVDEISFPDMSEKRVVGVSLHSGKNRIIRRMFEHIGYKVLKLDRTYFAGLTKKDLPRGRWRLLTPKEINLLKMGAFN